MLFGCLRGPRGRGQVAGRGHSRRARGRPWRGLARRRELPGRRCREGRARQARRRPAPDRREPGEARLRRGRDRRRAGAAGRAGRRRRAPDGRRAGKDRCWALRARGKRAAGRRRSPADCRRSGLLGGRNSGRHLPEARAAQLRARRAYLQPRRDRRLGTDALGPHGRRVARRRLVAPLVRDHGARSPRGRERGQRRPSSLCREGDFVHRPAHGNRRLRGVPADRRELR